MSQTSELVFHKAPVIEARIRIWTAPELVEPWEVSDEFPGALDVAKQNLPEGRWPKVRSGERELIPWPIRLGVAMRDEYSCRKCHRNIQAVSTFEVDHIVPWSAGGSDVSTNLRFLCKPCNQERSNFIDCTESRPVRPITWWCMECWGVEDYWRSSLGKGQVYDMNISRRVDDPFVRAFCAQCQQLSWTDMTL